jgi:NitT/TauT family transport system substrate-binding protein
MKKLLTLLIALGMLLNGCVKVKPVELTILTPAGAPATALIPLMGVGSPDKVTVVDGSDALGAALVKGDYDIIVAPVNLGLTLASKGNADYILYGILTWGNLYVVGDATSSLETKGDVALFGQAAVPQKIWDTVKSSLGSIRSDIYYNAVADVQVQLLTKKVGLGLMAEPAVSATIAKAKAQGLILHVVADLQTEWKKVTGKDNYPQAGLFIKKNTDKKTRAAISNRFTQISDFVANMNADPQKISAAVDEIGAAKLGVASGAIIASAWPRMNIKPVVAKEALTEIETFMELFQIRDIAEFIDK